MAVKTNWQPLVPIPRVSIVPTRVCAYTYFEGKRYSKRRVMPKLSGVKDAVRLDDNPYGFCELMKVSEHAKSTLSPVQLEESQKWCDEQNIPIIAHNNRLQNLLDNKPKKLSIQAKKRILNCLNWFYVLAQPKKYKFIAKKGQNKGNEIESTFKLNMVTLTLCADQFHSDRYIKSEMLDAFLKRLRYNYGLKSYIWRAERQRNKRIHFHIVTNIYVPHAEGRAMWNDIQRKHGYIDAYKATGGDDNPNGFDVHSLQNVKKTVAYMAKYMAKDGTEDTDKNKDYDGNYLKPIDGRQWFCSQTLSEIEPIIVEGTDRQFEDELIELTKDKKWKHEDYASWVYVDIFSMNLKKFPVLNSLKQQAIDKYSPLIN